MSLTVLAAKSMEVRGRPVRADGSAVVRGGPPAMLRLGEVGLGVGLEGWRDSVVC